MFVVFRVHSQAAFRFCVAEDRNIFSRLGDHLFQVHLLQSSPWRSLSLWYLKISLSLEAFPYFTVLALVWRARRTTAS